MSATYVYGVVRAGYQLPDQLTGVAAEPVELIEHDGLGALVSAAPVERRLGTRDDLLAHEKVVDTVAASATVLPMRFGSVVERSGVVDELLGDEHAGELSAALDELDGHVQYTVRGRYDRDVVLREVVTENPDIAALRERIQGTSEEASYPDRVRLGELVVKAIEDRARQEGQGMHDALARIAADALARESGEPDEVLNSAFLVEWDAVAEFEKAVDQLGAEAAGRVRFRLIGPLAPYDFVRSE